MTQNFTCSFVYRLMIHYYVFFWRLSQASSLIVLLITLYLINYLLLFQFIEAFCTNTSIISRVIMVNDNGDFDGVLKIFSKH